MSGGRVPNVGDPDPEQGGEGEQGVGVGARTFALQPISSSVPNPSGTGAGPGMHDYAICAGAVGAQAVQVIPGLLGANAPVMMTSHAVIGGSSMAASASASESASMPL